MGFIQDPNEQPVAFLQKRPRIAERDNKSRIGWKMPYDVIGFLLLVYGLRYFKKMLTGFFCPQPLTNLHSRLDPLTLKGC
jgi:hypothetical protein